MVRMFQTLLFSSMIVFVCTTANCQTKINQTIECSWLEYDCGTLDIGETVSCTLVIKNISKKPLNIEYVINGCSCISTVVQNKKLRPDREAQILIKFNTKDKQPGENYQNFALCTSDKKVYSFILKALLQ